MRTLYLILLVCIIFTLHAGLQAQWISSTGNFGYTITCLAVSDSNLFAGTEDGVFLLTNSGTSWNNKQERRIR